MKRTVATVLTVALLVLAAGRLAGGARAVGQRTIVMSRVEAGPAAYVAYYWKAKPGKLEAYTEYITTIAEKIDESARQAGVFEEVHTVMPAPNASGPAPEWTHLRIFKLKNMAAVEGLSPGLDAATTRVVPDEAQRKANSARAAELRDFVRQEIWTELR